MQLAASNLEFKLNVNLRLLKPDFMQSTAVNLEFKLKVIFKLLSCNRPIVSELSGIEVDRSIGIGMPGPNISKNNIPYKNTTKFPALWKGYKT